MITGVTAVFMRSLFGELLFTYCCCYIVVLVCSVGCMIGHRQPEKGHRPKRDGGAESQWLALAQALAQKKLPAPIDVSCHHESACGCVYYVCAPLSAQRLALLIILRCYIFIAGINTIDVTILHRRY